MDVLATAKFVHQSPRKVRLVTSAVSSLTPAEAMTQLQLMNKKAAKSVSDVIKSAVANATNNFKLSEDALWIKTLEVNEGPTMKRMSARSRGRANTMLRRMAHIRVVLTDEAKPEVKKRPASSFQRPAKAKKVEAALE